jgi:predicted porin
MKKSLIALAVLSTIAGSVAAQSSVTVYGRFDQGYNKVELKDGAGATTKSTNTGLDGGIGGSRLGFRGTEDLGGGLKANFVVEFGVDMGENVGANATRLGFAEIASPAVGTARLGRQVSPVKAVLDGFRPSGNNTNFRPGDFYHADGYMNADQRVSNAITYITPTFSGFSAQYQISEVNNTTATGESTTQLAADPRTILNSGLTQANGSGGSLNYSAGKFAAAYSMFTLETKALGATTAEDEVTTFAASYDLGVAKVFALYSEREVKGAGGAKVFDADLTTVGVTAPVGKWALSAEYSDGSDKAIAGEEPGTDVQGYKLRAMYNLSKRTGVYAQLGESKYKSKDAAEGTSKVEGYNIGVVHTF